MVTLTINEDPDEILLYVAFQQGLHCLLRQHQSSEKEIKYFLEIETCDPSIYIKCSCTILTFLFVALWKIPLVLKRLNYHSEYPS